MVGRGGSKSAQGGFTLVELLFGLAIMSALMVISMFSFQAYSQHRQLAGADNVMVNQLRQLQQQAQAVSNPSVFGAWIRGGDNSDWGPVEYVPGTGQCLKRGERDFDSGPFDAGDIRIETITPPFDGSDETSGFTNGPMVFGLPLADFCQAQLSNADDFIFFFGRGDATAGQLTITHSRTDRSRTIRVSGITGRVESCRSVVGGECLD